MRVLIRMRWITISSWSDPALELWSRFSLFLESLGCQLVDKNWSGSTSEIERDAGNDTLFRDFLENHLLYEI